MPYFVDEILKAASQSGRSNRDISIAAVGHESAIRSLKRGLDPRLSTIIALANELDMEIKIGASTSTRNFINQNILEECILAVREEIHGKNLELSAEKESQAISALYDICVAADSQKSNPEKIAKNIIKLAG